MFRQITINPEIHYNMTHVFTILPGRLRTRRQCPLNGKAFESFETHVESRGAVIKLEELQGEPSSAQKSKKATPRVTRV